ncbi:MAG: hypothetical protein KDI32_07495, partial [Pseudomonadales bacterium]|nr:hypothetical protein [Pseudomonadales bacterium]
MTGCTACPVCGASASREVYRIEQAPVTCAAVFASAAQARAVPTGRVDLVVCEACGFLYNSAFDAETAQSGARYESSQAASAHFGSFAKQLANDWVERYQLRGQAIIEVGCGHGEFLAQMLAAGVGRGIGIDPLADPARVPIELRSQLRVLPERFESLVDTLAGVALICRHTLEHVADPARFLAAVRAWCAAASGRVALFEVPATERVLTEGAFWDIYYE